MFLAALLLLTPAEPVEAVRVAVTSSDWIATYKGRVTTWPRSTPAADVERLAGEWGRQVDTPVVLPPAVQEAPRPGFVLRPAVQTVYTAGGT